MKRSYAFANAVITSLVLSLLQCSSESSNDDSEEGGAAGTSAGKGGSGKGGSAGSSAGSAGKGGAAGKGGGAGTGGSGGAGTSGAAGTSGGAAGADAGAAGDAGTFGGEAGADGSEAGAGGAGTGGSGGDNTGGVPSEGGSAGVPNNEGGGGQGGTDNPGGAGGGSGGDAGPEGDRCDTAAVIGAGELEAQSTAGFTHDYTLSSCLPYGTSGPDRVYEIQIPPANRLAVEVTPSQGFDPAVALIATPEANCVAAPQCLTQADVGFGNAPEAVTFANDTGEAQSVYLLVDGFIGQPAGGTFDIDAAVTPTPIGDICQNPLALGEGTEIAGSLAAEGISDDYSVAACLAYSSIGPDVAYRVELPAGSRLDVTVNPSDDLDVAVFFQIAQGSTCNRESCLGAADDDVAGGNESATYTNGSASTQTVYVIVDSFEPDFSTPGPFHLDVNITP